MKKVLPVLSLALALASAHSFAADNYQLDPSLSSVSFATIKNQFVVEPATINTLSGTFDSSGKFEVSIDLKGVQTGIPIRDSRLNELFFDSAKFPTVTVSGNVDTQSLSDAPQKLTVSAQVTLHGQTKTISFSVVAFKSDGHVMVSSLSPVIVGASDFGIPTENLANLAATVGGIKISDRVPLNLTLTFKEK